MSYFVGVFTVNCHTPPPPVPGGRKEYQPIWFSQKSGKEQQNWSKNGNIFTRGTETNVERCTKSKNLSTVRGGKGIGTNNLRIGMDQNFRAKLGLSIKSTVYAYMRTYLFFWIVVFFSAFRTSRIPVPISFRCMQSWTKTLLSNHEVLAGFFFYFYEDFKKNGWR